MNGFVGGPLLGLGRLKSGPGGTRDRQRHTRPMPTDRHVHRKNLKRRKKVTTRFRNFADFRNARLTGVNRRRFAVAERLAGLIQWTERSWSVVDTHARSRSVRAWGRQSSIDVVAVIRSKQSSSAAAGLRCDLLTYFSRACSLHLN